MPRQDLKLLLLLVVASCLLLSVGCSNVSGALGIQPAPPQTFRPCEIPYRERAEDLEKQADTTVPLGGPEMVALWKSDAAQYNDLKPRFNANIAWAGEHCVAKPAEPEKQEKTFHIF